MPNTNLLELSIATPEQELLRTFIEGISVPTVDGQITVLPNHQPLMTVLKAGELILHTAKGPQPFAVGGGFLETDGRKITILADTAERAEDIDEQRAMEAVERAKHIQTEKGVDHVEYAAVAAKLERDLARLHIVRKHKHTGHRGITHTGIRPE